MTPEKIQQVRERCEKALAALDRPPSWVWWVDKAGEMRLQTVGRGWQIILDVVRRGMQGAGLTARHRGLVYDAQIHHLQQQDDALWETVGREG